MITDEQARRFQRMHGHNWLCTVAVGLVLANAGRTLAQSTPSSAPAKNLPPPEAARPLSPLHAFLGIDPVTGEFKPPNAPPARAPAQTTATPSREEQNPQAASPPATAGGQPPAKGESLEELLTRATETGELPPGNTRVGDTTLDELRARLTKAVNEGDDQALSAALRSATGVGNGGELFPGANYLQLATLALLIYPMGIAIGAFFSAWLAGRREVRTDRDRKQDGRQLRRRLTLAASVAGTIGICWLAGENNFWWNEPRKLGAALVAATALMLVSAGLRMLIRRSATDYARKTIEDLRCQHASLSREVKELRKRLQGEGIPETV
jgi:hypothetical protein